MLFIPSQEEYAGNFPYDALDGETKEQIEIMEALSSIPSILPLGYDPVELDLALIVSGIEGMVKLNTLHNELLKQIRANPLLTHTAFTVTIRAEENYAGLDEIEEGELLPETHLTYNLSEVLPKAFKRTREAFHSALIAALKACHSEI
jgi:hypothetical protein